MTWWRRSGTSTREEVAAAQIAALTASRRAVVEAYEIERRRIERDLHDGTQQYLVAAAMKLGEAELLVERDSAPELAQLLGEAKAALRAGLAQVRATVRGIHPQVLVELGLEAALRDVAQATSTHIAIVCPHPLPPLPEGVLAVGYFFACEAIANAHKYAPGAQVSVLLCVDDALRISVLDTGQGGACVEPGHGLAGMNERLAAFGGTLTLSSPHGGPTRVAADIPLLLHRGEHGVIVGDFTHD